MVALRDFARSILKKTKIVQITQAILLKSTEVSTRYHLGSWNSLIVATALLNDCTLLYSEDMQDGLVIENVLTVQNPFKLIA